MRSAASVSRALIATESPPASRWPNSGTPESTRKHLKPATPSSSIAQMLGALSGTAPPRSATSARRFPRSAATFARTASTVTVGGMEFSGMSTIVVTPPAAAARVAVSKPSHSVRPGSLTCTWVSTRPGSSTSSSPRVTVRAALGGASYAEIAARRPSPTPTQTEDSVPPTIARRARTTRSSSAATVGGVAERTQQQRDVVVPLVGGDGDRDGDLGVEAVGLVDRDLEPQGVGAPGQVGSEGRDAA